jgi:hypothetical protein
MTTALARVWLGAGAVTDCVWVRTDRSDRGEDEPQPSSASNDSNDSNTVARARLIGNEL